MKVTLLPLAAAAALSCCVSCSFRVAPDLKPETSALAAVPDRGFAGELKRMAAARPGRSGFAMIPGNREAFTDRVALADAARETLDVQYYIWSPDTIGSHGGSPAGDGVCQSPQEPRDRGGLLRGPQARPRARAATFGPRGEGQGADQFAGIDQPAYRVTLEEGRRVKWETRIEGRSVTWDNPPETTFFERFKVGVLSRLPIESQL